MADCDLKTHLILPDECAGDCEDGRCLPLRMTSYFIFWLQAADCACAPGRAPTDAEHETLVGGFPNLPKDGYSVTGGETEDYNCIGWSRCSRTFGWMWPNQFMYPTAADQMKYFDDLYGNAGWKRAPDCRPVRGRRKIALYCKDGKPTHAAKQLRGDQWTSKLGRLVRIVHVGTRALVGPSYGKVCRCYEKPLADVLAEAKALLAAIQRRIAAGDLGLDAAERDAQDQVRQWEADLAKEGSQ